MSCGSSGGLLFGKHAGCPQVSPDGYGALVFPGRDEAAMQTAVNTNIEHVFNRLGQS